MKKNKSFWVNLYDDVRDLCSDPLVCIVTAALFCLSTALVITLIFMYPILIPIILITIALFIGAYKIIKFMAEAEDIDG